MKGFPPPGAPEIAFAGRSNVGKSSLINELTGHGGLARTSRTPGRTRLVNWFDVVSPRGAALSFVDLPGYGYAAVGADLRKSWRPLIEAYLARPVLAAVVLLVDVRRDITAEEVDFLAWLAERDRPVIPVLTKADKISKHQRPPTAAAARRALGARRDPILCSTLEGFGFDELWRAIGQALA